MFLSTYQLHHMFLTISAASCVSRPPLDNYVSHHISCLTCVTASPGHNLERFFLTFSEQKPNSMESHTLIQAGGPRLFLTTPLHWPSWQGISILAVDFVRMPISNYLGDLAIILFCRRSPTHIYSSNCTKSRLTPWIKYGLKCG